MNRKLLILMLMSLSLLALPACNTAPDQTVDDANQSTPTAAESPSESEPLLSHSDAQPIEVERSPDVPKLPFEDNADPSLCGIPQQWNSDEPAYLSGIYQGELIQPVVYLYDSHLRRNIVGQASHGSEIKIMLSQSNPTLDYFLVKVVNAETAIEGWVPAPFVSFDPPPEAGGLS